MNFEPVFFSIFFVLGLIFGSFINSLVYRLNEQPDKLLAPRSFCPQCQKKISWFDNIPLLSFFLLKGRCRHCHCPISISYPAIELSGGILSVVTASLALSSGLSLLMIALELVVAFCFLAILLSDLKYMTIPDLTLVPLTLVGLFFTWRSQPINHILSALISALIFFGLHQLTIRKKQSMGLGDVKLVFVLGLLLGFPNIAVSLFLSFLTGGVIGAILLISKRVKFGQYIPFGPFLLLGGMVALWWGEKISHFYFKMLY